MSDQNSEKSIDQAIAACEANIRRHSRHASVEGLFALVLAAFILAFAYFVATLNGKQNDRELRELQSTLERAQSENWQPYRASLGSPIAPPPSETAYPSNEVGAAAYKAALESYKARREKQEEAEREAFKNAEEKHNGDVKKAADALIAHKPVLLMPDSLLYGVGALLVLVIGIANGLVRAHMRSITNNEQCRLGLQRIRIAANNAGTIGFDQVQMVLVTGAFDLQQDGSLINVGRFKSPLPGHPGSDLLTAAMNATIEGMELVMRPKPKGKPRAIKPTTVAD